MSRQARKAIARRARAFLSRRLAMLGPRRAEGQSAIEFLLVLPLFFWIMFIMVDLGLLMFQYVSVSNAVREGARFGSVLCQSSTCTVADIQNRTVARSPGFLTTADVTVVWEDTNGDGFNCKKGDSVAVSVARTHNMIWIPVGAPVSSAAAMRLERSSAAGNC